MKMIRLFLSVVALVIVVSVIAIGSLMFLVDPNRLKPVIAEEVMTRTGYQLVIAGNLRWSYFPRLAVKVNRMELFDANKTTPFVDLKDIAIGLRLSQILFGKNILQGDIRIADVTFMNVKAQNAHVGLHWEKNVLTLQPIDATLYSGTIEGVAHGQNLTDVPAWDWNVSLNDVQIKPLLQDTNGLHNKIVVSGVAQVKLQESSMGTSRADVISHLNGTMDFSVKSGALEGVDVNYYLLTAEGILNKQASSSVENTNQTTFSSFTGSANIKDGIATTDNLLLITPAFITRGKADINLSTQGLDSELRIMPQQGGLQWEVPLVVAGTLGSPDVKLDMAELDKFIAKQQLDKLRLSVKDKIKQHIHGKAGDYLQSLLGK